MRITVHIPDTLKREIKITAQNEKRSVSSLVAEAVQYYVRDTKRKKQGKKMLELIGKAKVSPDILQELESGRRTDDRA
ncbi:MAG TPA: hypothetical protein ENH82_15940 [bacterium]|nr:hypothetical protein [bacterium]